MLGRRSRLVWAVLGLGVIACSHDWDSYDPRLGSGGSTSGGTGGASGSGGSGGASGSGATGGAAGSGGSTGGAAGSAGAAGSGGSTGGAAGSGGATGGAAGSGGSTGGAAGSGGSGGGTVKYAAVVADCVDTTNPDPDFCETQNGSMSVDGSNDAMVPPDAGTEPPTAGFMRFDLDNALSGKVVTQVTLNVTVNNDSSADGPESGEVWTVSSFTHASLFSSVPTKIAKVGNTQGPVVQLQTVSWLLPSNSVGAGQSVYLGLFPTSGDGIDYYNAKGTTPPELVIDYQ